MALRDPSRLRGAHNGEKGRLLRLEREVVLSLPFSSRC